MLFRGHFRNNKILGKLFKEHEQKTAKHRIEMVCLWTKSPHFWDLTRITGISDSFSCFSLQLWVKNRTKRSMLAQNRSATILLSHWGLNMTVSELIELHAKICSKKQENLKVKCSWKILMNYLERKKMKQLMTRNIEDESNHDNSIFQLS